MGDTSLVGVNQHSLLNGDVYLQHQLKMSPMNYKLTVKFCSISYYSYRFKVLFCIIKKTKVDEDNSSTGLKKFIGNLTMEGILADNSTQAFIQADGPLH